VATITVKSNASVPAEPDEATVAITLSALRATPDVAYRVVAERAQTFASLCDELGIERAQRSTAGLTVQAEFEFVEGRNEPRGYRATSRTHVRVRDASLVARLLEQAVARAEAHVEGPWWSVDQDNPARLEACRRAAATARQKAEAYAQALGVQLASLQTVSEPGTIIGGGSVARGPQSFDAMAVPIPVEPGEHLVSAAVELTYALES
jgi:uncharacterized protein YggE